MRRFHAVPGTGSLLLPVFFMLALVLPGAPQAEPRQGPLATVKSWGYQLQAYDFNRLVLSPHDLLVIDLARDGTDRQFTRREIERLRRHPDGGRRIVLAYMSIGEAEIYRDYWRWYWGGSWYANLLGWFLAPKWVGAENSDWRGNFAVRYWDPGWQSQIIGKAGYLERIMEAGFDGVYLDKVDACLDAIARDRPSAKDDMRAFVRRIADTARAASPGFMIVPQNGEELLDDAAYTALIDGIAKEDLLFGEFKEKRANPETAIARRTGELMEAAASGKTVLAVEYLDDPTTIAKARARLEALGFVPFFADRELKTLRYGDLPGTAGGAGH